MSTNSKFYESIATPAIVTTFLLLIPLVAMQFTDEVVWTLSDFIFAGTFLFGTGLTYKLVTRKSADLSYRVAVGFALLTGLFLIWVNGAVGIVGSEANPANLMYYGVIFVGIVGAFIARFQSQGMVLTMCGMAIVQALIAVIILVGGMYQSPPSSVIQILAVNGFFITLFVVAALLFRYAAQEQSPTSNNLED